MNTYQNTLAKLNQLPEPLLQEVNNFIDSLLLKENQTLSPKTPTDNINLSQDPDTFNLMQLQKQASPNGTTPKRIFTMTQPQPNEIWLVQFPFSDLSSTKLRPALVISIHREEIILIGIFSKIPTITLQNTWVLISEQNSNFEQTGLRKTSLIRTDKIATVNKTVFVKKLGTLPIDIIPLVQLALKKALNLFEE